MLNRTKAKYKITWTNHDRLHLFLETNDLELAIARYEMAIANYINVRMFDDGVAI